MNKINNKSKKTLILVIIICVLIVVSVGTTLAYFSANVTGNTDSNNVEVTTATVGNIAVVYGSNNMISFSNSLAYADKGTDSTDLIDFSVTASSLSGARLKYIVSINVDSNSFCQYAVGTDYCALSAGSYCLKSDGTVDLTKNSSTCTGVGVWTTAVNVANEINYTLQSCSSLGSGCSNIANKVNIAYPVSGEVDVYTGTLTPSVKSNYFRVITSMKNLNTVQNYNQNSSISATVKVKASDVLNLS